MKKLLFILLLLTYIASFAQEFGTNGTIITDVSGSNDYLSKMIVQEDGKLVVAGYLDQPTGSFVVARYNVDGSPDQSFGNKGLVITSIGDYDQATALAVQKDGRTVVVGYTRKNNSNYFAVVRYNIDGSLDLTFDQDGMATTGTENGYMSAYAVSLQDDRKIVVGGLASFYRADDRYALARYYVVGSLDYSFGNSGTVIIAGGGAIKAVAIQSDNKIVAAGYLYHPYFSSDYALLRFNSDGSLDNSFESDGIITINKGRENQLGDVNIQPDGKIVAGGFSTTAFDIYSLFRFNTDGSPDRSFNGTGSVFSQPGFSSDAPLGIVATALQSDGKIVALTNNQFVLRFNNNGTADSSFYNVGWKKISFDGKVARASSLQLFGNYIYIGSSVNNGSVETPNYDFAITRLDNPTNISFICPASVTIDNDKESCGAVINNISPVFGQGAAEINFALTGATNTTGSRDASGTYFNTGTTTVTYFLKDNPANACSFTVTVNDVEAPVISGLSPSVTTLWPPNHKMHTVKLAYDSKDNCGVKSCNVTVTSNEPEEDSPAWTIINDHEISLRAERNGNGNGRIYTIKVVCTDEAGNEAAPAATTVTVPHSKGKSSKKVGPDNDAEQEERDAFIVTAAPNPSTNHFTIKIEQANGLLPVSLKIIDLAGRIVESKNGIESRKTITAGAKLHPGVYFAEIIQGGQKRILKLIKK